MKTRATLCATLLAFAALTGCSSGSDDKPDAPAYEITAQDDSGNSRDVEVTVDSAKDLKAVFDAVTTDLTDEAGYHVYINCSTGGTAKMDNRLANGRLARGTMGEATTGLKDGESEFEAVEGHTCP
ncbi:hypothetical protein ABZZ79_27770 [Streptomyces sp. NPDC006458]|uniref:hypothetical protein n=1 Tax=Streptomyces sp. NPDC006458 TaxID=3154302 RepID=UPI0033AA777F